MILNDKQIIELCNETVERPMINPFISTQHGKPSGGLGSFGYDLHLGKFMLVPVYDLTKHEVIDPLNFPIDSFKKICVDKHFDIAPNSFVLAETVEEFDMPNDVCGVVWGKSTYARCGLLCNVTPLEPGWRGVLTMELANVGHLPIRIHVGKGIAQVVMFRGNRPIRTYKEKESGGVYQDQVGVTAPR